MNGDGWLEAQMRRDNDRFRKMRQWALAERVKLWYDVPNDDDEFVDKSGCSCIARCSCQTHSCETIVKVKRRRFM